MTSKTLAPANITPTQRRVLRLLDIADRAVWRTGHFLYLSMPGDQAADRFPAASVDHLVTRGLIAERDGIMRRI